MAIGDGLNNSALILEDIVVKFGEFGKWLQAIGLVILFWIGFQIFNLWLNSRKKRELVKLRDDVKRLEGKIDKLVKKRK